MNEGHLYLVREEGKFIPIVPTQSTPKTKRKFQLVPISNKKYQNIYIVHFLIQLTLKLKKTVPLHFPKRNEIFKFLSFLRTQVNSSNPFPSPSRPPIKSSNPFLSPSRPPIKSSNPFLSPSGPPIISSNSFASRTDGSLVTVTNNCIPKIRKKQLITYNFSNYERKFSFIF